eukprot:TRINITY_DN1240_c0_g1_i2.p2 TRINITY_DN1240_c0_g1~~TRINITY_DN1240_c0_g1_i2.p2  ORF type:complete len:104 (+),score=11.34 TRINITY_DN1240_c0_g1_i2:43-354(+)
MCIRDRYQRRVRGFCKDNKQQWLQLELKNAATLLNVNVDAILETVLVKINLTVLHVIVRDKKLKLTHAEMKHVPVKAHVLVVQAASVAPVSYTHLTLPTTPYV